MFLWWISKIKELRDCVYQILFYSRRILNWTHEGNPSDSWFLTFEVWVIAGVNTVKSCVKIALLKSDPMSRWAAATFEDAGGYFICSLGPGTLAVKPGCSSSLLGIANPLSLLFAKLGNTHQIILSLFESVFLSSHGSLQSPLVQIRRFIITFTKFLPGLHSPKPAEPLGQSWRGIEDFNATRWTRIITFSGPLKCSYSLPPPSQFQMLGIRWWIVFFRFHEGLQPLKPTWNI